MEVTGLSCVLLQLDVESQYAPQWMWRESNPRGLAVFKTSPPPGTPVICSPKLNGLRRGDHPRRLLVPPPSDLASLRTTCDMVSHVATATLSKLTKCAAMTVRATAPTAIFPRFASIDHRHRNSYRCREVAVSGHRFPPDATLRMQSDRRLSALTTTTLQRRVKYVYIIQD